MAAETAERTATTQGRVNIDGQEVIFSYLGTFKTGPYGRTLTRSGDLRNLSAASTTLFNLLEHANVDGHAWPSLATMSAEIGLSTRQIAKHLKRLEVYGIILSAVYHVDNGGYGLCWILQPIESIGQPCPIPHGTLQAARYMDGKTPRYRIQYDPAFECPTSRPSVSEYNRQRPGSKEKNRGEKVHALQNRMDQEVHARMDLSDYPRIDQSVDARMDGLVHQRTYNEDPRYEEPRGEEPSFITSAEADVMATQQAAPPFIESHATIARSSSKDSDGSIPPILHTPSGFAARPAALTISPSLRRLTDQHLESHAWCLVCREAADHHAAGCAFAAHLAAQDTGDEQDVAM